MKMPLAIPNIPPKALAPSETANSHTASFIAVIMSYFKHQVKNRGTFVKPYTVRIFEVPDNQFCE